jgi:predicted transcriptional regulator
MMIVWRLGECSVAEVRAHLPRHRALAHTTVATVLGIMGDKGVLGSRLESRRLLYRALVTKRRYQRWLLRLVVHDYFDDDWEALVAQIPRRQRERIE